MWFYYSIPRRRRRTRTHSSHPIIIISTRLLLGRFRRSLIWDVSVIETNGFTGGGAARSQCRPLTTIHRRPKYINGNGDHLWWFSMYDFQHENRRGLHSTLSLDRAWKWDWVSEEISNHQKIRGMSNETYSCNYTLSPSQTDTPGETSNSLYPPRQLSMIDKEEEE